MSARSDTMDVHLLAATMAVNDVRDAHGHVLYSGQANSVLAATPLFGYDLKRRWRVGERVEYVRGGYSGNPMMVRPGTVSDVEEYLMRHQALIVTFDDGETRGINHDVMRHVREGR